jgi:hypothetical protein
MMSFLTFITGFFMDFEILPILTDQSEPNFAERGPPKDHFSKVWFRLPQ